MKRKQKRGLQHRSEEGSRRRSSGAHCGQTGSEVEIGTGRQYGPGSITMKETLGAGQP